MNNLNRDAFLVNEITIKTNLANLSAGDRQRFEEIKARFHKTKQISDWDMSELRRFRAQSNRRDTRWLYQDVQARFNTVFNPMRSR